MRAPDNDTEQADKPRLRMATVAPRISTGRAMVDVNEFSDMILLRLRCLGKYEANAARGPFACRIAAPTI